MGEEMALSTLGLQQTMEESQARKESGFLDILVDGESLQRKVEAYDRAGVLGWGLDEASSLHELLGKTASRLPSGRVPLYVCPECGDVDCGTVAVRIAFSADTVVWSDFTLEVTYYWDDPTERVQERYPNVGPFVFDRVQYEAVLGLRLAEVQG